MHDMMHYMAWHGMALADIRFRYNLTVLHTKYFSGIFDVSDELHARKNLYIQCKIACMLQYILYQRGETYRYSLASLI